jgi:D-glycero-D-manno-heptose 1,7-bisphosphate phosphatase
VKLTFQRAADFRGVTCVFLDRDGVINRKAVEGKYISEWGEFAILPGIEKAIANLNRRQCRVLVVSNQRGIALGLNTVEAVEEIHNRLQQHLASYNARVDRFYYCPHDVGECDCRKPATGLFERAVRDFPSVTPQTSMMIGDSICDIEAAQKFGCRSIYIRGNPSTRKAGSEKAERLADAVAGSLPEAVKILLDL